MKHLLSICFLALASWASAQQYTSIVKTNPLGYFASQYMIGYEHMLNDRMSIQVMPGFINRKTDQNATDYDEFLNPVYNHRYEQTKSGFILIPEFRYYVSPDATGAPHGLYLAAFTRFMSLKYDLADVRDLDYFHYDAASMTTEVRSANVSRVDQRTVLGGGITIGYAYYTSGGVTLEGFIGPQFKNVAFTRTYADFADVEAGDEAFDAKYADFSLSGVENSGGGVRFGVNVGIGF